MTGIDWTFPYPSRRMPVLARNVVATSQPLAAQAGLRMIERGGNAVDAALAAAITLTVVEPVNNGVGSDAFAIVWDGQGLGGLNASGRAPAALDPERFARQGSMPGSGWDSVTVPGAVSAWVELSRRYGRVPFAELFTSGIGYAREGYPVSPVVAHQWELQAGLHGERAGFAATFLPGGRAPRAGEIFRCEALARTLEEIATSAGESFYRGSLGEKIAADAHEAGAALTADDLAEHRAEWVDPLGVDFAGHRLHEIPPNTQGLAALIALGILERLGIGEHAVDSADSVHLELEAMKLAFADVHRHIGDPRFMMRSAAEFLDPAYLDERAAKVDRRRAGAYESGRGAQGDTVYLCAADASGMMVSYIQSNYFGFGSGVVVPGTGISLQNRGSGFTLEAGHPNRVGGGKRPFHTLIPGFVTRDGQPLMAFGVMGGPMQAQGHVQMMVRIALHGQNPQAAADAPRWQVLQGRDVGVESNFSADVLDDLTARGHNFSTLGSLWFGGAQLAYRLGDAYVAASEPRKDGLALGT